MMNSSGYEYILYSIVLKISERIISCFGKWWPVDFNINNILYLFNGILLNILNLY